MIYYNFILTIIIFIFIIYALTCKKKRSFSVKFNKIIESRKFELVYIVLIMILCSSLRLLELSNLPAGMSQDEASIAYDSWAIVNYGIDRNGYHNPVYPIAWGAGHGPFYMYFASFFLKLFGNSLFVYRLPEALLSILSVFVFYLILRKSTDRFTSYIGILLLTLSPWHIMISRWGLDANPAPLLILLSVYFFIRATENKKILFYILSAIILAFSLYSYASTYISVPIFLLIVLIIALKRKYMNIKELIISGIAFSIVALPLLLFWIINFFHLNEIITPFFSFPRLVALRSDTAFIPINKYFIIEVVKNIGNLFLLLYSYPKNEIYNVIDGYNIIYVFTFPLLILGMIISFKKTFKDKQNDLDYIFCAWFIGSIIYSLIVNQNINRLNVLFIPVIYFVTIGIKYLADNTKELCIITLSFILVTSCLFINTYFGPEYRKQIGNKFMYGFEDAIRYANSLDSDTLYCTDVFTDNKTDVYVNGSYIKLMYYCEIDPNLFYKTVEYYDENVEFRFAKKFDKYNFMIPEDITSDEYINDVFVLTNDYKEKFDERFNIKQFDNFIVVKRKDT